MNLPPELLNAPVLFGLEAQGHIPTIEKMLAEGKDWEAISSTIGWDASTARENYERYAQRGGSDLQQEACPVLAKAVEVLKKVAKMPEMPVWDRNNIYSTVLMAEKHLISTPKKVNNGS